MNRDQQKIPLQTRPHCDDLIRRAARVQDSIGDQLSLTTRIPSASDKPSWSNSASAPRATAGAFQSRGCPAKEAPKAAQSSWGSATPMKQSEPPPAHSSMLEKRGLRVLGCLIDPGNTIAPFGGDFSHQFVCQRHIILDLRVLTFMDARGLPERARAACQDAQSVPSVAGPQGGVGPAAPWPSPCGALSRCRRSTSPVNSKTRRVCPPPMLNDRLAWSSRARWSAAMSARMPLESMNDTARKSTTTREPARSRWWMILASSTPAVVRSTSPDARKLTRSRSLVTSRPKSGRGTTWHSFAGLSPGCRG
jgi:hypothetical protein